MVNRRPRILGFSGLALVLFLVSLDQTVVSAAMPQVIAELNGFERYAWVTTIYLLCETAVIPIAGKLGDLYGRKWVTIAGVGIFVGASALCGFASSMWALTAFRGLQGLGGGILLSTAFTVLADIFPDPRDRARYQGILFAVFALSSMIGPFIGGVITDTFSWRWVFFVNLPLGLAALFVLPRVLPHSIRQTGARIDYWGALASTIAIVALLLSLELVGAGSAWTSLPVLGGLFAGFGALIAFVLIERRAAEPIIPLSLFRNRTFAVANMVLFIVGAAMFGVIVYLQLFLQGVMGLSASAAGSVMTPMIVTMTVMNILVGQLVARWGRIKPLLLLGLGLLSAGIWLLTTLTPASDAVLVTSYIVLLAAGMGMIMPVMTLAVQTTVEQSQLGVATSATTFIRSIGSTAGTAVIGTLVANRYVANLAAAAPRGTPEPALSALNSPNGLIDPNALEGLAHLLGGVPDAAGLIEQLLSAARTALAGAIQGGFGVVLVASVVAFGCALLLPDLRIGGTTVAPEQTPAPTANPATMAPRRQS